MRILLLYDALDTINQLLEYIDDYFIGHHFSIYLKAINYVFEEKEIGCFDICFIQLSDNLEEDTMNFWKKYIHKNKNPSIFIFICDSVGMVENIPSLNPILFVRKNRMGRDLSNVFITINKYVSKKNFILKTSFHNQYPNIKLSDLLYIKDYGYETLLVTLQGTRLLFGSVEYVADEINNASIIPIKKTCYVNIDKISYIGNKYITLVTGEVLKVDKQFYDKIIDAYKENLIYGI